MRLIGVDLASQPKNTSVAVLDGTKLVHLASEADDDAIVDLASDCAVVGIDARSGGRMRSSMPLPPTTEANHRRRRPRRNPPAVPTTSSLSTAGSGRSASRPIASAWSLSRSVCSNDGRDRRRSIRRRRRTRRIRGAVAAWTLVDRSYKRADSGPERAAIVAALGRHLDLGGLTEQMAATTTPRRRAVRSDRLAAAGRTHELDESDTAQAARGLIHIPSGPIEDLAVLATLDG